MGLYNHKIAQGFCRYAGVEIIGRRCVASFRPVVVLVHRSEMAFEGYPFSELSRAQTIFSLSIVKRSKNFWPPT